MDGLYTITLRGEVIENNNLNNILQQIFTIPIDDEKYLVYATLKSIAFIGNNPLFKKHITKIRNICLSRIIEGSSYEKNHIIR
jgi:hypothetical protein